MTIDNEQLTIKESLRDKLKSYIVFIGFTWQFDKLVFADPFRKCRNNTVGEPFIEIME